MKEVTLKCRVITPLFMGDANMDPEIRTQSIKGVIRFWWRALKSMNDINELKEEENRIFGGYICENAVSSKIKIVVLTNNLQIGDDLKRENRLEWSFNQNNRTLQEKHYGIGYLLYSVLRRRYIKPSNIFTLKIQSNYEDSLKQTLAALWCAIYLGGFGARSRRGAGSVIVDNIENNITNINFIPNVSIEEWYKNNLKKCFSLLNVNGPTTNCKYSNLLKAKLIISQQGFSTWIDVLNDIGKKYSDFRLQNRREILKSAIFGLPVIHRNGKVLTNNNIIKRRSSPIVLKIIRYNNSYYWVALLLGGEFLPGDVKISFNNQLQSPDFSLINNFWEDIIEENNTEIILQEVFNA